MKVELSGHYGYARILKTMLPCVAMMLVNSVYSIVDGFFISNFAGSTAFAAMNLIWPALSLVAAFGLMLGTGGSALVSMLLGQKNEKMACAVFTMLVRVAIAVSVITSAGVFIFMRPLVLALGSDADMLEPAVMYGRVVAAALPLLVLQMFFQSFYMVAEKPAMGTVVSVMCGVANIVLDAVLVAGFRMGLAGAAIGTAAALGAGGIFPLLWFRSKRNATHLRFVRTRIHWRHVLKACSNGISEYVGNIALSVVSICYNLQLMKYIGGDGVSAYGIIMYEGFIFAALMIGYNVGISQVISYNYGAGNKAELSSLLRKSLVIEGVCGIVITAVAELSAGTIAGWFVGYDKELCYLTSHGSSIYMLSFLLCGFNLFCSAWFTALNNGIVSAVAAFTRTFVFELGSVFILPSFFGLDGVWMSVNAAEIMAFIMTLSLIVAFRKRYGYSLRKTVSG